MQDSGWYPDPDGTPGRLRWWDGQNWSDLTTSGATPAGGTPPPPPTPGDTEHDVIAGPGGEPRAPAWGRVRGPGPRVQAAVDRVRALGPRWQAAGLGLAIVLVLVLVARVGGMSGSDTTAKPDAAGGSASPQPQRDVPPLARVCHPSAGAPSPAPPSGRPPAGPRVTDTDAGISYVRLGAPWQTWNTEWFGGTLGVVYRVGYSFVTQHDVPGNRGDYFATVLSGSVPATAGDSLHPDMKCVAQQVADDARRSFYPTPNARREIAGRPMTIGGHRAYLVEFHLSFDVSGYQAKGELAAILAVDVGTTRAAVVYVSIPDTHKRFDPVVDQVVASVSVP